MNVLTHDELQDRRPVTHAHQIVPAGTGVA